MSKKEIINIHPLDAFRMFFYSLIHAKSRILLSWQFIRYLLVGGTLFLIDLSVFLVLVQFCELDIRIAQGVSRTTGAIVGFFAHKYITFEATSNNSVISVKNQGLIYTLATISINILFSPFIVWSIVQLLPGRLVLSKIISEILLVLLIYLILRTIFKTRGIANCIDNSR